MCELVMNGIGGTTIAEAKRNLSAEEVRLWADYRMQRGTLNLGMRLEELFAISDHRHLQSWGSKIDIDKLIRYHDEDREEDESDLVAIAKMFGVPYEVRRHG